MPLFAGHFQGYRYYLKFAFIPESHCSSCESFVLEEDESVSSSVPEQPTGMTVGGKCDALFTSSEGVSPREYPKSHP